MNFLAPITRMDKLACIGLNYSGHCQEQGISTPESPIIFSKFPSNIIGPRDNILLPQISDVSRWRDYCGGEEEKENAGLPLRIVSIPLYPEPCIFSPPGLRHDPRFHFRSIRSELWAHHAPFCCDSFTSGFSRGP